MARLFSYVVEHDEGRSPNPFGRYCSLAHCKFSLDGRRKNVVESADEGDWIVGTGGATARSAGHGRLIYAMKIKHKLTLEEYYRDKRFSGRIDNRPGDSRRRDRFALIGTEFYYFGANAPRIPQTLMRHPLEKKGPGFRKNFDEAFVDSFVTWLRTSFDRGRQGNPVCGRPTEQRSKRPCW